MRHLAREYSPEPFAIETVPRVGYSLVSGPPGHTAVRGANRRSKLLSIVLLMVLMLAAGAGYYWHRLEQIRSAPASIAVLPFDLTNGNAFFVEGLSEEILDQLTREPAFRVAGPASTAATASETDLRKVGGKLGVDYVY